MSVSVRPSNCPTCGTRLEAATFVGDDNRAPEPGDVTICIGCTAILRFTEDLSLRILPADELVALPAGARRAIFTVQRAVKRYQRSKESAHDEHQ